MDNAPTFYVQQKRSGEEAFRFSERTLAIIKNGENSIRFEEECDNFFSFTCSKQEAIIGLKTAINWIEDNFSG